MCYGKVRGGGDGAFVIGGVGGVGVVFWGGVDVFEVVRLSCGRLGGCGRGKRGGVDGGLGWEVEWGSGGSEGGGTGGCQ